jgi:hypothetical protein
VVLRNETHNVPSRNVDSQRRFVDLSQIADFRIDLAEYKLADRANAIMILVDVQPFVWIRLK